MIGAIEEHEPSKPEDSDRVLDVAIVAVHFRNGLKINKASEIWYFGSFISAQGLRLHKVR